MKSTCVLVTGSNRGYGEAIAKAFSHSLDESCALIIHSRIDEETDIQGRCKIIKVVGDLKTDVVAKTLDEMDLSEYNSGYLIHNAGSPGNCSTTILKQKATGDYYNDFFASNLTQLIRISQVFLPKFGDRVCVNISSLLALIRVKKCVMYSVAKAARNVIIENMGKSIIDTYCNASDLSFGRHKWILSQLGARPNANQNVRIHERNSHRRPRIYTNRR